MAALGEWTTNRMRYNTAGVRCSFVPDRGTVTISATKSAVVPVTGLCSESSEVYGGQCISYVSLSPGQTVTYNVGTTANAEQPTPVGDVEPGGALMASLSPNPLNPEAKLKFRTTKPGFAKVRVYDLAGRLVRSLLDEPNLPPGDHEVRVGARRAGGEGLPSGVFFYRVETAEGMAAGRFVVMK